MLFIIVADLGTGENSMTCGDSGFSEMELTSSGSDAAEPEKRSISRLVLFW